MFLAYPIAYSFKLDRNFHTVNIAEKWKDKQDLCLEIVCAALAQTSDAAKDKLEQNVKEYFLTFPDLQDGKIRLEDLEYRYYISEVDSSGSVNIARNMSMYGKIE